MKGTETCLKIKITSGDNLCLSPLSGEEHPKFNFNIDEGKVGQREITKREGKLKINSNSKIGRKWVKVEEM